MKTQAPPGSHLSNEEIVLRVFPVGDGASPVPLHLAACQSCQSRVARLREGALMEQGAIDGVLGAIPEEFWRQQELQVMQHVRSAAAEKPRVLAFRLPVSGQLLRRPALALGSLAAAILLVAVLSLSRSSPDPVPQVKNTAPATVTPVTAALSEADRLDDELLLFVDQTLSEEDSVAYLLPEDV